MLSTKELQEAYMVSIKPGIVQDDAFYRKLYGWSMNDPEFLDRVCQMGALMGVEIRTGYEAWVRAYEAEQEEVRKDVAVWYMKQKKDREGVKEWRTNSSVQELKQNLSELEQRSSELKKLLNKLEEGQSLVTEEGPAF